MKRAVVFAVVAVSILAAGIIAAFVVNYASLNRTRAHWPFLVGVTYCGNSVTEAKIMVDRVRNYTNLFVLQSGPLMGDTNAVNEIGDYAVANGLRFAVFFDTSTPAQNAIWLGTAEQRWSDMFAGVYYGDEPGGKMLDANVDLTDWSSLSTPAAFNGNASTGVNFTNPIKTIHKLADGGLQTVDGIYFPDGRILVSSSNNSLPNPSFWSRSNSDKFEVFEGYDFFTATNYYPNGSVLSRRLPLQPYTTPMAQ